ncbi:hypothetical protein DW886_04670 [Enterocloster aldenensis]|nr:hypothetical protein DW886_04670 [Enterocloster aldenensis]
MRIKLLIIAAPVALALTVSGFRQEGKAVAGEGMGISLTGDGTAAHTGDTGFGHLQLQLDTETYRFPVSYRNYIARGFR